MVRHHVAPNLLMVVLLLGGLLMSLQIKQEVFPDFELDVITISVSYPGSSPEEVERGLVTAIEEAVRGIVGVKEVRSESSEGSGQVTLELESGVNRDSKFQEVQQAVNRIRTLPDDAEEPRVSLASRTRDVMDILLYGDVDEWTLRQMGEFVREQLLLSPDVTQVELDGIRDVEIHVDVPEENLRAYNLTLSDIATIIRNSALDRAGGSIETKAGEILLRVQERRDVAREFANIPIIAGKSGTVVRLGDIATVTQGFADTDFEVTFNGKPSVGVEVYRVGNQTPVSVATAVKDRLPEIMSNLPPSVHYVVQDDDSEIYQQRLDLLLKNGFMGLVLVLILLTLFLEFKLAFWVTVGIPTAFLGTLIFLPLWDVSLNMMSMFAFIIALGIVVDDAIIAGENIYEYRQRGYSLIEAGIQGAKDIAVPVSFSVLTNIVAFLPLMFMPGFFGRIFGVVPIVVATTFALSWVEALLILPAHLAHTKAGNSTGIGRKLHDVQQKFSRGFLTFVDRVYGPSLRWGMEHRYLTVSALVVLLMVVAAFPLSNRMGFVLMPQVESNRADASAVLPVGVPVSRAEAVRDQLVTAAMKVVEENGGEALSKGVYARIRENEVDVRIYLTAPEVRPIPTLEVANLWREATGDVTGVEYVRFESDSGGPGGGPNVNVELSHSNIQTLEKAARDLAGRLSAFASVQDVDDGTSDGKAQLDFRLTDAARSLGLTAANIGQQVRSAFYGAEALRQQVGRDEVKVLVRLPESERNSLNDIENLILRTPTGGDVPLYQVAQVERGSAYTSIERRDGRRTTSVTARVVPQSETSRVLADLSNEMLPQLMKDYPGLTYSYQGQQAEIDDTLSSFMVTVTIALIGIYVLLAIPLGSYLQPAIVMISIPFGVVGAIMGHMIMGYNMSMVSMMGVIALGGVVVNGSLVMVHYANQLREEEGMTAFEAILAAGVRRFRPIVLTTLTTFGGLAPMIFETSRQARFMIPMALSLGYGIIFSTAILLLLIPCLYMVVEDLKDLLGKRQEGRAKTALHEDGAGQAAE